MLNNNSNRNLFRKSIRAELESRSSRWKARMRCQISIMLLFPWNWWQATSILPPLLSKAKGIRLRQSQHFQVSTNSKENQQKLQWFAHFMVRMAHLLTRIKVVTTIRHLLTLWVIYSLRTWRIKAVLEASEVQASNLEKEDNHYHLASLLSSSSSFKCHSPTTWVVICKEHTCKRSEMCKSETRRKLLART